MCSWIFNNSRIKARPVEVDDASYYTKWWNDGKLMESVGFKNGLNISLEKTTKILEKCISSTNPKDNKMFIILDSKNDLPIGELVYGEYDEELRNCRIGIKICELDYQGKGYGYESCVEFFKYLFTNLHLQTILIDTLLTNTRAINLYQRLGSKTTQILRNFWTSPEGISYDVIFFELSKDDFYNNLMIK